jgi:hypothetical protein
MACAPLDTRNDVVGEEIDAGLYRVSRYWARLDEDQEIGGHDRIGEL